MNQASRADSAALNAPAITDLGADVFQIDTRMAGYEGVTAGYLIRGSRPCLVRTRERYIALRDDCEPAAAGKLDRLTATAANVAGIIRWLDKTEPLDS
jgi:hypothetical protein